MDRGEMKDSIFTEIKNCTLLERKTTLAGRSGSGFVWIHWMVFFCHGETIQTLFNCRLKVSFTDLDPWIGNGFPAHGRTGWWRQKASIGSMFGVRDGCARCTQMPPTQ